MEIGKKIKKIRLSKGITQSALSGDKITRNMLSQIENGSATPSLGTIIYISEKLGMPVGYFLANEGEDVIYSKIAAMGEIKKAYRAGEYERCITLCSECKDGEDDELSMILCECHFKIGESHLESARLVSSHRSLNTALHYAEKTLYNVEWIRISCYAYLDYISTLSPALRFEVTDRQHEMTESLVRIDLRTYTAAKRFIENKEPDKAEKLLLAAHFEKTVLADHIRAKLEMYYGRYDGALVIMQEALDKTEEKKPGDALLYSFYSDMEICFRENKDFENAYIYATKKAEILPELGK